MTTPSVVITGGRVVTCDAAGTVAEAVALAGDRIAAVGSAADLRRSRGPVTEVIDLRGRSVVPGFVDSHNHMLHAGLEFQKASLAEARTIADLHAVIRAACDRVRPGEWVVASSGWHESQLRERRLPTRAELDAAAPHHPVFVPRGGHTAVVNSLALQRAGITREGPHPAGGDIKRDPATGEPLGILFEPPALNLVANLIPKATDDDKRAGLVDVMRRYNAAGITSVIDPGLTPAELRLYQQMSLEGRLTVRVNAMPGFGYADWPSATGENIRALAVTSGFGGDMLTIDAIKLFADGGVETAFLSEPYEIVPGEQPRTDFRGVLLMPPERLRDLVVTAHEAGLRVGVHAVGDAAIDLVLDAFAAAHARRSIAGRRFVLIHGILAQERHYPRLREMGVIVSCNVHHYALGGNMVRYWGAARAARADPIREYIDHGIVVGGGTDAVVCPYDHLLAVWADMTRRTRSGDVLGPDLRLTRDEALRLHTIWAAAVACDEARRGSIEVGKFADLVVLGGDILRCAEDEIPTLPVEMTWVGGRLVHATRDAARQGPGPQGT